jgi:HTH-type transcriptional regulator/antitoxin HigA
MDTLGTLIAAYETDHHPVPASSGADMLRYFMEERGLAQSELPEVGSQGVVSEVLNGKRELNLRQVRALAQRFHVSPAVFIL